MTLWKCSNCGAIAGTCKCESGWTEGITISADRPPMWSIPTVMIDHAGEIGRLEKRLDRLRGTIKIIEEIAVEYCGEHEAISSIYKFAHVVNSPDCVKNHPQWADDLDKALKGEADDE